MKTYTLLAVVVLLPLVVRGQVIQISINANGPKHLISPYLFGKNNVLPSTYLNNGGDEEVIRAREAGLKIVRQGGGNNSTKYNWRDKISSHPDWYNNVYVNDWDAAAANLRDQLPGVQGMWSFQLLGKVAANTQNNFNDWGYNRSQWWQGVHQNLAGGGVVNPNGAGKALTEGNPALYLKDWPADSTVAILDHWFGENGLSYDPQFYQYWSMDNEPEIWQGTHDDVMKSQIPAEEFMQRYFKVAKAARAKFPDIKLLGPVPANEWQWYRYGNEEIVWKGKKYPWLEYFILRVGEEEAASGIKLLDVLDIHYYPSSSDPLQLLQFPRVFFDKSYDYPEANGVKTVEGGWNNSITKEYIFERCREWLTKYKGVNHGVGLGMTEYGINTSNANVQALFYASMLGEFMKNKVEVFTPWSWSPGMWETVHLFSRYGLENYLTTNGGDQQLVSAYPTISTSEDSMVIFFVNRDLNVSKNISLTLEGFVPTTTSNLYSLFKLPSEETFMSHSDNALKTKTINSPSSTINITLEALSVNALVLKSQTTASQITIDNDPDLNIYPNPGTGSYVIDLQNISSVVKMVEVYNVSGQMIAIKPQQKLHNQQNITLDLSDQSNGIYLIKLVTDKGPYFKKIALHK